MANKELTSESKMYSISYAAATVGMSVQSLRLYEVKGLLHPVRTDGGTRRYSEADLRRVQRIVDLVAEGLNLVGIEKVLALENENTRLRAALKAQ